MVIAGFAKESAGILGMEEVQEDFERRSPD